MKKNKSDNSKMIRLNQFIAHAGICNRRKADELIASGLVKINGKFVTKMGVRISNQDKVEFNGKELEINKKQYIILNKSKGKSYPFDGFLAKNDILKLYALIHNFT